MKEDKQIQEWEKEFEKDCEEIWHYMKTARSWGIDLLPSLKKHICKVEQLTEQRCVKEIAESCPIEKHECSVKCGCGEFSEGYDDCVESVKNWLYSITNKRK